MAEQIIGVNDKMNLTQGRFYIAEDVEKRCSENALKDIQENNWNGILIKTVDEFETMMNNYANKIESQLRRKEKEIEQIDAILCELFGIIHDDMETPDGFKEVLKEKVSEFADDSKPFPSEPIKVADMIINAKAEYERGSIEKIFLGDGKGKYNIFNISQLRQIAEHLLVYCNNKENTNG